jgi:hypothetical protein
MNSHISELGLPRIKVESDPEQFQCLSPDQAFQIWIELAKKDRTETEQKLYDVTTMLLAYAAAIVTVTKDKIERPVPSVGQPNAGSGFNRFGYILDDLRQPKCPHCGKSTNRAYLGTPNLKCWDCGNPMTPNAEKGTTTK